jgi:hypothetical protein
MKTPQIVIHAPDDSSNHSSVVVPPPELVEIKKIESKDNQISVTSSEEESADSDTLKQDYIEVINKSNRKLHKDLYGKLMEFKKSSREIMGSLVSNPEDEKKENPPPNDDSIHKSKHAMLKEVNNLIILYNELNQTSNQLRIAKKKILDTETETLELDEKLKKIESCISNQLSKKPSNCQCTVI